MSNPNDGEIVANATAEMKPARMPHQRPRQVDGCHYFAEQHAAGVGIGGIATRSAILPYPMTQQHRKE